MRQGFSLIELSIVLVIIALIAGGVMLGKDLIRAAELRGQITQFKEVQSAFLAFKDKYQALPGDMANATDFWGIAGGATGIDAACYDTDSTTLADPKATCNGNGDGWVTYNSYCAAGDNCYWAERFRFWQHLANAGLLEGRYTGRTGPLDKWDTTPDNVPAGKIRKSFIQFGSLGSQPSGAPDAFDGTGLNHRVAIGGNADTGGSAIRVFTPEEAWNIDSKIDDGKPATGNAFSYKKDSTVAPNCTTANDATAEYDFTNTDKVCAFIFAVMRRN